MDGQILRSMVRHMAWANELVLASLNDAPGSDTAGLEQFAHVLAAEHVWLTRIQGHPSRVSVWPSLTLAECATLAAENHAGLQALVDGPPTELTRAVTYTNSAGKVFTNRVVDILVHIALHGAYHRGMVSLIVRRGGGRPAPTDFIAYIRGAPTATRLGS
jgi:uncharacterized damage-inducible protein DinB